MKSAKLHQIPKMLKSLGVGGVLGSGTGTAIFLMLPPEWKTGFSLHDFALMGAAFATLIHRAAVCIAPTLAYVGRHITISFEVRIGWMELSDAASFRRGLQLEHYRPARSYATIAALPNRKALKQVAAGTTETSHGRGNVA